MLKCLLVQIRKNRPVITLTLIFSCLLSTIPQFFYRMLIIHFRDSIRI